MPHARIRACASRLRTSLFPSPPRPDCAAPQHVSTLAHELGHAYHNWVMKDMPLEEAAYPMNLAETASIVR